jgi:hypothetical protein
MNITLHFCINDNPSCLLWCAFTFKELHPFSLSLANGIPIPDHLLRAPIAYDYIERNAYGRDLLQL